MQLGAAMIATLRNQKRRLEAAVEELRGQLRVVPLEGLVRAEAERFGPLEDDTQLMSLGTFATLLRTERMVSMWTTWSLSGHCQQ